MLNASSKFYIYTHYIYIYIYIYIYMYIVVISHWYIPVHIIMCYSGYWWSVGKVGCLARVLLPVCTWCIHMHRRMQQNPGLILAGMSVTGQRQRRQYSAVVTSVLMVILMININTFVATFLFRTFILISTPIIDMYQNAMTMKEIC